MNKLEKDILESEMGIYSNSKKNVDEEKEDERVISEEETDTEPETLPAFTEDGVQLKIDDFFFERPEDDENSFYVDGYQDELDISSLGHMTEDDEPPKKEKERDGTRLYRETVLLIESGEVDLEHGIALLRKNAAEGHSLSWVYLGQIYSNKTGDVYNPALAFDCYKEAAEQGYGEGFYNLGLAYCKGFGCDRDDEAAVECFSNGAKIFNPDCIFALGTCYEFGVGCEINYEFAFTLYERACELDHADGANNLGGCYFHGNGVEQDKEKAIEIYKRAASLGSSDALCRLGIIYETGDGTGADIQKAFEYYKASAAVKNKIGLYRLGRCYDLGIGAEQNYNKAFKYYSRSASLGYDPAKYEAGRMCISGRGTKKNYDAAYDYFISAAQNGYAPAEYEAANCNFDGNGAMKNREMAYLYYCRAYESDNVNRADAAYKIGLCHLKGLGVKKDEKTAFDWFSSASRLGSPEALYMLGECCYFGVGTDKDEAIAVEHFLKSESEFESEKADKSEYVSLLLALGHCFELGIGIEADPRRARLLYKAAAESGRADALYEHGRAMLYGLGMKPEYAAARPLFLRSARRGYAPSMLMMGMFSDDWNGATQNRDDAQNWYFKAINHDDEPHMSIFDFPNRFAENSKAYTESKIKAQFRLGMLISKTEKSIQGYTKAFEYVSLSASMGYSLAQAEIARIYVSGGDLTEYYEGRSFAPDESYSEFGETPPDKNALGEAMNKLGDTFFDGKQTIKKNENAAARCYRYAAELGNVDAAYSYGWCLRHGVGVRENDTEAARWLKMAADKGNANAAYSYGLCCEEGAGTGIKNKREALYYYRMAASAGHGDAALRFVKLSGRDG